MELHYAQWLKDSFNGLKETAAKIVTDLFWEGYKYQIPAKELLPSFELQEDLTLDLITETVELNIKEPLETTVNFDAGDLILNQMTLIDLINLAERVERRLIMNLNIYARPLPEDAETSSKSITIKELKVKQKERASC